MTRVAAAFVGCKISQADGEQALVELAAAGFEPVPAREQADVVVVHTCCVTAEAERKSRRLARRLAATGARVVVAGCAARLRPEQFAAPGIEVMAGERWAGLADAAVQPADGRAAPAGPPAGVAGGTPASAPAAAPGARTRLLLKVQDGCSGICSYCVVRFVRGRPRSTSLRDALAAARAGLARGCGEVVLSGVDLGAWRDGGRRLPDLVKALVELPGLERLRLSSLEPGHVDDELLGALAHPRVARHLHLPLQSADDGVLAAMRRPYTFAQYEATVRRARDTILGVLLSTDVIAGFPGEDEAAFGRTLASIEGGIFGRVHVFGFSARLGTAAAELPPLPAALVKDRVGRALAAAEAAARAARRAALGRPADVLVEERRDGLWRGYSSEYIRYYLSGAAAPGRLVSAVATDEFKDGVRGRVKEPRT